jgi:hypothetical protein
MKVMRLLLTCTATMALSMIVNVADAKVNEQEAAQLDGPQLTCYGAERAGSSTGVAEFTGKYQGTWPGL